MSLPGIADLAPQTPCPRSSARTVHAARKLVVDDVTYVGSANLDVRSHQINYELLLRTTDRHVVDQARATVVSVQADSIEVGATRPADSLLVRWRERIAYLALSRLDPYIAQRKLRNLQ